MYTAPESHYTIHAGGKGGYRSFVCEAHQLLQSLLPGVLVNQASLVVHVCAASVHAPVWLTPCFPLCHPLGCLVCLACVLAGNSRSLRSRRRKRQGQAIRGHRCSRRTLGSRLTAAGQQQATTTCLAMVHLRQHRQQVAMGCLAQREQQQQQVVVVLGPGLGAMVPAVIRPGQGLHRQGQQDMGSSSSRHHQWRMGGQGSKVRLAATSSRGISSQGTSRAATTRAVETL